MKIADEHRATLASLAAHLPARSDQWRAIAAETATKAGRQWDVMAPALALDSAIQSAGFSADVVTRKAIVAAFALELPDRIRSMHLPEPVLSLYPRAFDMLLRSLQDEAEHYTFDFYGKDVRLVLGLSVPAGAQFVDLYARLGPKVILRQLTRPGGLRAGLSYSLAGGYRPWLQIHTDTRDVSDFNEEGWNACYLKVAALLKRDPSLVGLIGNSWFYDPALLQISPRLGYLQKPFDHGAFRIWTGATELDKKRAGSKSSTRKAMIEAGTYVPTSYILAWPRHALLKWAEQ